MPESPSPGPAAPLVLASASPQRTAILTALHVAHVVRAADVDERADGDPREVVCENAAAKAAAVAARQPPGTVVLAADTVVLGLDGRPLGKPRDAAEAAAMLREHAGRAHRVRSAACVHVAGEAEPLVLDDATTVRFRAYDEAVVAWYVGLGEWRGRAGGYAIQERGGLLVDGVDGDWWAVVGLPVAALAARAPRVLGLPGAAA